MTKREELSRVNKLQDSGIAESGVLVFLQVCSVLLCVDVRERACFFVLPGPLLIIVQVLCLLTLEGTFLIPIYMLRYYGNFQAGDNKIT